MALLYACHVVTECDSSVPVEGQLDGHLNVAVGTHPLRLDELLAVARVGESRPCPGPGPSCRGQTETGGVRSAALWSGQVTEPTHRPDGGGGETERRGTGQVTDPTHRPDGGWDRETGDVRSVALHRGQVRSRSQDKRRPV